MAIKYNVFTDSDNPGNGRFETYGFKGEVVTEIEFRSDAYNNQKKHNKKQKKNTNDNKNIM